MELVMVGIIFSALNFGAMSGFVEGYEALVEPEADTQVEIYELGSAESQSDSSNNNELVIASVSDS